MKIPEFDALQQVADEIVELSRQKGLLDIQIKFEESELIKKCMIDPQYFQNGKPPSMSFIESTFKFTGLGNELVEMRKEFVEISAKLERARLTWEIYKQQFEIYRTESANNRNVGQIL